MAGASAGALGARILSAKNSKAAFRERLSGEQAGLRSTPATHPGYALRFPRFMDYRLDKSAEDATEIHEIIRMYNDQFKR